jgi:hypothetical protein
MLAYPINLIKMEIEFTPTEVFHYG